MTSNLVKERAAAALLQMTEPEPAEERATWQSGGNPQTPAYWVQQLFNGGYGPTSSGVDVNEKSALTFTAVFACVRVLSETMGALDPFVYRRLPDGGKEKLRDHPVYRLIHDEPNEETVPSVFRETLMGHICTWGNGYAEIERTGRGIPAALWNIEPHRVRPERTPGGALVYKVTQERGPDITFDYEDILHIPGLGYDGLKGYSPVAMAREAVGLGKAAEQFGAKFYGSGANSSGSLTHPQNLSPKAFANLRESWQRKNSGLDNAHTPLILEEGMKYERWTIPPNEAQFLETRKFQRGEIASIYRVPPHMIGDLERATFSNIEQQSIDFIQNTMLPWVKVWEQWLGKRLLTPQERADGIFIEFLITGLLRGDAQSRAAYYNILRNAGVVNADEIRDWENMNPQEGGQGKVYWRPSNVTDASKPPPDATTTTAPATPPKGPNNLAPNPDGRAKTLEALRIVAMDAAKRIVSKETLAMGRAKKKADEYRMKSDEFFKDHAAYVAEVLSPVVSAMTTAGMDAVNINAVASAHVVRAKEACAVDVAGWEKAGALELVQELFKE